MIITKDSIKKKILELETIKEKLFYLDVIEKEVNDRISELYIKTRMNDYGEFLGGENGWEFVFESRKFDPEFMMTPPLTTNQQEQYINNYGKEIKEAEHLHNMNSFIKDQKKFYEKQLVKYTLTENGGDRTKGSKKDKKITYDCFGYNFNEIKKYADNLGQEEAIIYYKYVLKEFDRVKRENELLFLSKEDIEYSKKEFNRLINDNEYANVNLWGIGEKQKNLTKNFEINIQNEIKFLQDKNNLKLKNEDVININETIELKKILDTYYEYGKECYLNTWKEDRIQLLAFEREMKKKFGLQVTKYVVRIFNHIEKNINPIELIECDIEKYKLDKSNIKIQAEIVRINEYIKEIEKLSMMTNNEVGIDEIPDGEVEKLNEWQYYYINNIKDKKLRYWVEYLTKNRPGVYDYKYGESYKVDFEWITENILKELKDYKDKLEYLGNNSETSTKSKRKKIKISNEVIAEEVVKHWDNGIEEFEEIYKIVSEESETVLGQFLTPGQVKGKYQRFRKDHKEYKREKYK